MSRGRIWPTPRAEASFDNSRPELGDRTSREESAAVSLAGEATWRDQFRRIHVEEAKRRIVIVGAGGGLAERPWKG